ncbi:MAG: PIN domain-containing protein [Candidatus Riflebacteria bacterium]|nr:PIN domain-containing protein [Candidatus Riflebacteria bacterium]
MRYLLDTDTCADVLRGRPDVVARLRKVLPDDVAVSTISVYELFTGVGKCARPERERSKVRLLLETIHELPFLAETARQATRVRVDLEARGCTIGPYDTLLAGHALAAGLILITPNLDEFSRVGGLRFESWRKP